MAVHKRGKAAFGLLALALLAGCVTDSGSGTYSQTATVPGQDQLYTVVSGDTLWGIARNQGVPLQSLIDSNGMSEPYLLQIGQQLRIPGQGPGPGVVPATAQAPITAQQAVVQDPNPALPLATSATAIPVPLTNQAAPTQAVGQPAVLPGATVAPASQTASQAASQAFRTPGPGAAPHSYQVQPGETLYAVSRQTGLPVATLAEANGIQPPYDLRAGQILTLPDPPRSASLLQEASAQPAQLGTAELDGQNLSGDAAAASAAAAAALAATANLSQGATDTPGTTAATAGDQVATATTAPLDQSAAASPALPLPSPAASSTATGLAAPPAKPQRDVSLAAPVSAPSAEQDVPPAANTSAALPEPPSRQGRLFDWPVTGRVISGYGSKPGGLRNDGINIAAPAGTPVRAAESGVVAYTGGDLKGFGKLVLIKHQDGYVTAYAHNSQILVRRGETVRRGDVIARVGETGNVDTPQLHFEIRKDASPIDPTGLMVRAAG
ncbi:MAG: peptidoglycan DD-metalloendopeptidase family protein [Pseudomonadota bacterium]